MRHNPILNYFIFSFLLFGFSLLLPVFSFAQTTYYLTTGTSNPQSSSVTYYDLNTLAGSSDSGLFTEPLQTSVDYAAEGLAGTYNYYIVPGINMASPESSTSNVTSSTGFGFETNSPLTCDISAGTWTFSNRFEGNIGSGSPAVHVEVSVYAYNGTTSTLLFNYTDPTDISSNLNPGVPYSYSFTTSQGAFAGTTGQSLKVEYYAQMVGTSAYAGGFVYLGFNTNTDFMNVPVCPPATNTSTSTATNTATSTSTDSATATATSTSTNTVTNTPTSTSTSTATNTVTNTPTSTATSTLTSTSTDTAINTQTATSTSTNTPTSTSSDTPANTGTNTPTSTLTNTSTNTATNTSTNVNTDTSTSTPTNINTQTATSTDTNASTGTSTGTATSTPTLTNTPTNTAANTQTSTSTATATCTDTRTVSCTATSTTTVTSTPTSNIHLPIMLFPNPVTGNGPVNVQVPLETPGDIKISIFSLAFRKVAEKDYPNSAPGAVISMAVQDKNGFPLANGLYYVRVQTALGTTLLKMLVLR